MLKRIAKYILIASMIFGTSNAVAEETTITKDTYGFNPVVKDSFLQVNARYLQYVGQLDTGKEGSTAHFKNFGETGVQFRSSVGGDGVGSAHFFVDMESRSGQEAFEFFDVMARASYITPVGRLNVGKVTNYMAQITTNPGGGAKGAVGGLGASWGTAMAGVCENDGIDLMVPLFNKSLILELTMWDKAAAKFRIIDPIKSGGFGLGQADKGSTMAFGGMYRGGPLVLKAGVTRETMDDYSIDTDKAKTNNYSQVSGQLTFGSISVNASLANASIKNISRLAVAGKIIDDLPEVMQTGKRKQYGGLSNADVTASMTGLGFKIKELGPGDLNLNYEALSSEDSTSAAIPADLQPVNLQREMVRMSLFYTVYISKKIGYQFVYSSRTTTPEVDDATTRTYIGGSLFGYF